MFVKVEKDQYVNTAWVSAFKRDIDTGEIKQCTTVDGRFWFIAKYYQEDFERAIEKEGGICERD